MQSWPGVRRWWFADPGVLIVTPYQTYGYSWQLSHVAAATCESCHEYPYVWYGVTIKTPGSANHHRRTPGQDCISSGCHNRSYTQFSNEARVRPVLRSALNGATIRVLPDGTPTTEPGTAATAFDHRGVLVGQCVTCHNGQAAHGLPARHLVTRASCD